MASLAHLVKLAVRLLDNGATREMLTNHDNIALKKTFDASIPSLGIRGIGNRRLSARGNDGLTEG